MADRYWVGGTNSWSATAGTRWSTTSGGPGGASAPTSTDNVFFDAASGAVTVTVSTTRSCLSLICTGFTGTLTGSLGSLNVYNTLTLVPGMTYTYTGPVVMRSTGTSTITTAGKTLGTLTFVTAGSWTLLDSLTSSGSITHSAGTLDTGANAVTATFLSSTGSTTRELRLGSDTWTLSGASPWTVSGSNLTIVPGTSVIRLTQATVTFPGAGYTYYDLWFSTSGGVKTVTGNNTFNGITAAPPTTLEFASGSTNVVASWGANGTAGNLVTLRTQGGAGAHHYLVATAPVVGDYLDISWSYATPDANWSATNSTDSGNNFGWFDPAFAFFSGTRTSVPMGDLDALIVSANPGDILVLAPGTHTLTEDVPVGVTLRGASCGSETIIQCENITPLGGNTFRDLTFQVASDPAAAVLNPSSTTWFENCIFDECPVYYGGPDAGETVTFSRCTFQAGASTGQICASADDGVGSVQWLHCLFKDQGNAVTTIFAGDFVGDTSGVSFLVSHCTFVLESTDSVACTVYTYLGVIEYWNNVHYQPSVSATPFRDASGNDSGGGNFYQDDYTVPPSETYLTQVRDLGIDPGTGALRNDSPARMGAQDNFSEYTDRNYLPYADIGERSSGCFQWRLDSSAIYRPWFLDPTDGFTFGYEPGVVPPTKTTEDLTAGVTQVNSHLEVACLIRKLVYDLAHPSRSECFVSWDGYYRILVTEFTFDLQITSPASQIFGSVSNTSITDTG